MIYFISDFHFGDNGILVYERTQFQDIQEHDNQILNLLETTTQYDTVWFLGDFGYATNEIKNRLMCLKCQMYMIKGNHDHQNSEYYKKNFGFKEVYDHPIWLTKRCVLSHIPVPVENGVVNIHGHLHGSFLDGENYVNANVHMLNYRMYSQKQLNSLIGKLPKPDYHFLKEWYVGKQILSQEQQLSRIDIKLDDQGHILAIKSIEEMRKDTLDHLNSLSQMIKPGYDLRYRGTKIIPLYQQRIQQAKTIKELDLINIELHKISQSNWANFL